MVIQNNTRLSKTFLTSVTLKIILMLHDRGLSFQQPKKSLHLMLWVAPLKSFQPKLFFKDQ